jgi:tripartite-type tricarboxylate transporter receptor subunit TctC
MSSPGFSLKASRRRSARTSSPRRRPTAIRCCWAASLPHVKSGRLRALGVTPIKRVSLLPDVPTLDEAGIPGFDYTTWYGLMASAGTPRAIVDRLNAETVAQLNGVTLQRRLEAQGLNAIPSTPAQFVAKLRSETEKWARAAAAKIQPE